MEILKFLRANHISSELYPDAIKFDKQLKYAHKKNVAYIIIIGEEELTKGYISIKNFKTGAQQKCEFESLAQHVEA